MFEMWPFTNFHDLNLDWIIGKISNIEKSEKAAKESEEAASDYAEDAKGYMQDAKSAKTQAAIFASQAGNSASAAAVTSDGILEHLNQIDANTESIANIVSGTTPDANAELIDIRVGYDGHNYTSAGDAVRGQVDDLHDELTANLQANVATTYTVNFLHTYIPLELNPGHLYGFTNGCAVNISLNAYDNGTSQDVENISNSLVPGASLITCTTKTADTLRVYSNQAGSIAIVDYGTVANRYDDVKNALDKLYLYRDLRLAANNNSTFPFPFIAGETYSVTHNSTGQMSVKLFDSTGTETETISNGFGAGTKTFVPSVNASYIRCWPQTACDVTVTGDSVGLVGDMQEQINQLAGNTGAAVQFEMCVPTEVYAVVGEPLQIFNDSLIYTNNERYSVNINSTVGTSYETYWEFTPTTPGTSTFTVYVTGNDNTVLYQKAVTVRAVAPANPTNNVNILCIGDSLMENGKIPIEISRRLKGTQGTATSPAPYNLTRFNLVGRLHNAGNTVGWEGHSGWAAVNYIGSNSPFYYNGSLDFAQYAADYCNNQIDVVIIALGTNDKAYFPDSSNYSGVETNMRTLIAAIQADFPNALIFIEGLVKTGGYCNHYGHYNHELCLRLNKRYMQIAADTNNVYYLDSNSQFDMPHGYPTSTQNVNTRSTVTQSYITDGVHHNNTGYWQKADAWLRAILYHI